MDRRRSISVRVGITGGMGSGKSTVSRFWSAYMGLPLIDIDGLCRELLEPEKTGWLALRRNLPASFFDHEGNLNRRQLRSALFHDDALRSMVNSLVHPLARLLMRERIQGYEDGLVLIDVPLLFESDWREDFTRSVVVYADPVACCRRIMDRDRIDPGETARSVRSQIPLSEKALLADHVIDNSGCWLFARQQVVHLARLLEKECVEKVFSQESA